MLNLEQVFGPVRDPRRWWEDRLNLSASKRAQAVIKIAICVVIAAILVTAVLDILRIRRDVMDEAVRSTSNLARTLEENSRITFEGVFQALGTASHLITRNPDILEYKNTETRQTLRHIVNATP